MCPFCPVCRKPIFGYLHPHVVKRHLPPCFKSLTNPSTPEEELVVRKQMDRRAEFWVNYGTVNTAYSSNVYGLLADLLQADEQILMNCTPVYGIPETQSRA